MRERLLIAIFSMLLFLGAGLAAPVTAADVTAAMVISAPGTYELQNDIINCGKTACFSITTSDVVFEGNSHTIGGLDVNGTYGIYVHNNTRAITNVTIRNVAVRDWYYGIILYNIGNGTVEGCSATSSTAGITLSLAINSTILENNASGNSARGISVESSSNNVLQGNTIDANTEGIRLSYSGSNRISGNRLSGNDDGIYLVSSSGNIIFDNSFNNTNNAEFLDASTNAWSIPREPGTNIRGGSTLGGNFWAHPNGTGFSVMTPDSDGDGVCDASYTPGSGNEDLLPLAAITGQHTPVFASEWPLRLLRSADGADTAEPTTLSYYYDSTPDGKGDNPDIIRFVVTMADAGLTLTANMSEVDGNMTPLAPYLISGNAYSFTYVIGDASHGNATSSRRSIPITAEIGPFLNSTTGKDGSPSPLTAILNMDPTGGDPHLSGTDWKSIEDFTAVEDLTVQRSAEGSLLGAVTFTGQVNVCSSEFADALLELGSCLQIEEGTIGLDVDAPGFSILNRTAALTMYVPNFTTTPGIFADGQPAWYANGTAAPGSMVSDVRWDGSAKVLTFAVSHWTAYAADGNGPDVVVFGPENNTVTEGSGITVHGGASDPAGVALIEVKVNDRPWQAAEGRESWSSTPELSEGGNPITIRATDAIGCMSLTTITVVRNTPAPVPTPVLTPPPQPAQSRGGGGGAVVTEFTGTGVLYSTGGGETVRGITVVSEEGVATITIPAGIRASDAYGEPIKTIRIQRLNLSDLIDTPLPSSTVFRDAWRVDPGDAQFDPAVTITFRVPEDEWRPDDQIGCMQFVHEWDSVPVIPDGEVKSFSAALSRSGIIALVTEVAPGSSDAPLREESSVVAAEGEQPSPTPRASWTGIMAVFSIIVVSGAYRLQFRRTR